MVAIMEATITIDAAGRLVIPKPLRERLNIGAGSRLHVTVRDGQLILAPDRPEPRLIERDGFFVVDLDIDDPVSLDTNAIRDERLQGLVAYAMKR